MAQNNLSLGGLAAPLNKIKTVLIRRASILFVALLLVALIYSIATVNVIIVNPPSDDNYRTEKESGGTSTRFDQATIEKIEALGERQNSPTPSLPGGRINPFAE